MFIIMILIPTLFDGMLQQGMYISIAGFGEIGFNVPMLIHKLTMKKSCEIHAD
jgi:hypothetical protein